MSLASSAAADFFPDPLPASTEAGASAPSPRPPRGLSRQASRAGECYSAPILHAGISPLCPPDPCGCALLRGSEASPSATRSLLPRRGFLVCGNLSSFTAPSHWCRSRPYSFALPKYVGIFLPFGRPDVFCQSSVGVL